MEARESRGARIAATRGLAAALAAGLAWGLGTAGSSCNVYDASLLLQVDAGSSEAGPPERRGIGWWSGPADDPRSCFSARFPRPEDRPPPSVKASIAPFYLAFQTLDTATLGEDGGLDREAWQGVGFDLDGTCTGSETCETPGETHISCKTESAGVPVDGKFCRDNTFGRLSYSASVVPEVGRAYGLNADAFNCALCVGAYNYLFRISEYNGEPDDDRVRVDLYPSPGLEQILPWDCRREDWKLRPCFTPDEKWNVREDVLTGPVPGPGQLPPSKLFDADAFVKKGVIVIALPANHVFWFPGNRALATAYPLAIQRGLVTAKLAKDKDNLWKATDGVVAGRARRDDVIKGFRLIGFCESDPNYKLLEPLISGNLDLLASGERNPQKPCDALSLGLPFTAIQALPGNPQKVTDLVECAARDGGVDGGGDAGVDAGVDAMDAGSD